ncbi:MAG TPA: ABC transporter permease [Candidatus Saccharimonadales bacterium]|nr:ABC transporter permease [Candidatus Saccharimonadales bacterium]
MKYLTKKNRAILREMVSTDFKVRYQGSALGYLWSLLRPLLMFSILYVVFVYIFKIGKGVDHFGAYLLLGIVLWSFFTEATSMGMTAVVGKGDLIRKISIPRYLVVVSTSASALINLLLNLGVVLAIVIINGVMPGLSWLWLVLILLELFIFAQAVAFFLAALFVRFRDVTYIWEVLTQAAFYATPILYPLQMVPERFHSWLLLNPAAQIIQDARQVIVTPQTINGWEVLSPAMALLPIGLVVLAAIGATWYFKVQSKSFAENI